eukprot:CAMPEP_0185255682 /NCGR_PEP_ID=MMETSP1359-20130426/4763_1 /TAXON_ID=552665 /ORGANISM="Bigelowiella longifila, Strain CCMP242" /LENGTH=207 /DNA_ID=CAMNT_0027839801 /DNA_START=105 /DNA_END=728 /DNA_ORIENTATION=+
MPIKPQATPAQFSAFKASRSIPQNSALRTRAVPVTSFDLPHIQKLFRDLKRIAKRENLLSLAAPQVGLSFRVFVLDLSNEPKDGELSIIVNPEVLEQSKLKVAADEFCCSLPGFTVSVPRPQEIEVSYQTEQGEHVETSLRGLMARCFLHELDHLEGKMHTDYAKSPLDISERRNTDLISGEGLVTLQKQQQRILKKEIKLQKKLKR